MESYSTSTVNFVPRSVGTKAAKLEELLLLTSPTRIFMIDAARRPTDSAVGG